MVSLRNSIWDQTWNKPAYSKKWLLWPHETWVFWEFIVAGFVSFCLFKLWFAKIFHSESTSTKRWQNKRDGIHVWQECLPCLEKNRYMKWGKTTDTPWYSDSYWSRKQPFVPSEWLASFLGQTGVSEEEFPFLDNKCRIVYNFTSCCSKKLVLLYYHMCIQKKLLDLELCQSPWIISPYYLPPSARDYTAVCQSIFARGAKWKAAHLHPKSEATNTGG